MPALRQAISASRVEAKLSQTRGKGKAPAARAKLPAERGHPARFAGCLLDKRAICPRSVRQLAHPQVEAQLSRTRGKAPAACAKLPAARGHPARFAGCLLDKRAICPRSVRQLAHPQVEAQLSRTRGKGKAPAACTKLPAARGHPARFAGCLLDKRAICPRSVRQLAHPRAEP